MEISVLGLNHHTAPVELREQLAFDPNRLPEALAMIRQRAKVSECAILSTCNRVELYTVLPEMNGQARALKQFLARTHGVAPEMIEDRLYWHLQPDSIRHLFRVTSGLDSMVLGESEILGQVRSAYAQAVEAGAVGSVFHRLFQAALRTGKAVRSQTGIGRGAVSVSSVAVELAGRIFRDIRTKRVLAIGSGHMGQLTVQCLKAQGVGEIWVTNRSDERAQAVAEKVAGRVAPIDRIEETLRETDIVICSTAADRFLLTVEQTRRAMVARRQRPLFLIDISVPRNLDPRIGQLENVYLYDIDDLEGIASTNLQTRLKEVETCNAIIETQLEEFVSRVSCVR
ncbi:MAG: glutamyl-tRNA reductase [Candidatus Omnitrophica bacterium CG11_big_fil_rev_8_21_14_0_20_64_10]|nr:MAG: glutamyl-tRNA reductase [Candidatus Omnitrophica bacterium CG11_big_fil_rev_8_21_14_0_20_64_10]